jgi:hypothetical protein
MRKWKIKCAIAIAALALAGCAPAATTGAGSTASTDAASDATASTDAASDVAASADTCTTDGCAAAATLTFPIVSTSQALCFGAQDAINCPSAGAAFYGQNAQTPGQAPSYTKSSDGLTVHDNVTGLTWQQSHHTGAVYLAGAEAVAAELNAKKYGGYSDWRLPTIKELYSLWNVKTGWPYIDTSYFAVSYASETELSHAIFWSSNKYAGLLESTLDVGVGAKMAFGVNFGTGHIKAYALSTGPQHLVRCVRGASYGLNDFLDNGDGTITDRATGMMWAQNDSGAGMDWEQALAYAQTQNDAKYLGHSDWRLPSTKELQSLVDYTRSPNATDATHVGPAIDPLFKCTGITNEVGAADFPWYWTSTSAIAHANGAYTAAWYVAFGRAVGSDGKDLHGAGAVRFDTKVAGTPSGENRSNDFVRLMRNVTATPASTQPHAAFSWSPNPAKPSNNVQFNDLSTGGPTSWSWTFGDGGTSDKASPTHVFAADGVFAVTLTVQSAQGKDSLTQAVTVSSSTSTGGGGGSQGPVACTTQSDCSAANACPADATKGCGCTTVPSGKACIPICGVASDCPKGPGVAFKCTGGFCVP